MHSAQAPAGCGSTAQRCFDGAYLREVILNESAQSGGELFLDQRRSDCDGREQAVSDVLSVLKMSWNALLFPNVTILGIQRPGFGNAVFEVDCGRLSETGVDGLIAEQVEH